MCGPASLKIILDYYGIQKSEQELSILCETDPELGTSDIGIKKAAESLGFKVMIQNKSSFEDIEDYLEKGIPVMVNWFTRGRSDYDESTVCDGHYSVVSGLDEDNVYLQDPEIGCERVINKEDFLTVWFDFTGKYIDPEELIIRQIIAISR
jgi:predicted double-glycine peptidase